MALSKHQALRSQSATNLLAVSIPEHLFLALLPDFGLFCPLRLLHATESDRSQTRQRNEAR